MRVRTDAQAVTAAHIHRTEMIEKTPGTDHAAVPARQCGRMVMPSPSTASRVAMRWLTGWLGAAGQSVETEVAD